MKKKVNDKMIKYDITAKRKILNRRRFINYSNESNIVSTTIPISRRSNAKIKDIMKYFYPEKNEVKITYNSNESFYTLKKIKGKWFKYSKKKKKWVKQRKDLRVE